jgi:hypothetical protein
MSPDVRIGYLVDHPEALPTLERLFQSEWAAYYGAAGPGNAHQDLVAYSNRGQLPIGLVAFLGAEPCGVAALKADSISSHKHLTPWIGGGMVAPQFRRHGIAADTSVAARAGRRRQVILLLRRASQLRRSGALGLPLILQKALAGLELD